MASVREVMTLLNVSRPTVLKWLNDDSRFPNAYKEDGATGEWNIPRQDVEKVRQEIIAEHQKQIKRLESLAALDWQ